MRPLTTAALLFVLLAAMVTACSTGPESAKAVGGASSVDENSLGAGAAPCAETALTPTEDRSLCVSAVGSRGFQVALLSPKGKAQTEIDVVVVDIGGPLTDSADAITQLRQVEAELPESTALVSLIPPRGEVPTTACRTATAAEFAERCNLDAIGARYVSGYGRALETVLDYYQVERVGLVGASYASARWTQLVAQGEAPLVTDAVFVSALTVGVRPDRIEQESTRVSIALVDAATKASCDEPSCLASVDTARLADCRKPDCITTRIAQALPAADDEVIAEGLTGLGPFAFDNGQLLQTYLEAGDDEAVQRLLEQGQRSATGLDGLGEVSLNEIHLLAGVCPILQGPFADGRYERCAGVTPAAVTPDAIDGANAPARVCYLVTAPDPYLGRAAMDGLQMGQSVERTIHHDPQHGNLALGARVYATARANETDKPCGRA